MQLIKGTKMKYVGPRITEDCHALLGQLWRSTNQGAEWLLAAFPNFYIRTLKELKGTFTKAELDLLIDLADSLIFLPEMAGFMFVVTLGDPIMTPAIEENHVEVNIEELRRKLHGLNLFQRAIVEIWAHAYRRTVGDVSRGDYLSALLSS